MKSILFESLLKKTKKQWKGILIFSFVIHLLMLAPSWYMLEIYDRVIVSGDDNTLLGISLIIVFLLILYALLENYRGKVLIQIAEDIEEMLLQKIYDSLFIKNKNYNKNNINNNNNLLNELNIIKQFLTGPSAVLFIDAPWFFIYLFVIYLFSFKLFILSVIGILLIVSLALINKKITNKKLNDAQNVAQNEKIELLSINHSIESLRIMGMQAQLTNRLRIIRKKFLEKLKEGSVFAIEAGALSKFFRFLIQNSILGLAAYLVIRQEISAGSIVASSILIVRIISPVDNIINLSKSLTDFIRSYKTLNDCLTENFSNDENKKKIKQNPKGNYLLKNVSLRFDQQKKPILDKFNLNLKNERITAIIGPSGAGKTTFLKILSGDLTPSEGDLELDGDKSPGFLNTQLKNNIGYLGQNLDLINGTIAENICRFEELDKKKLQEAAKYSGADEFIIKLDNGYQTIIGTAGVNLSQGQYKKIALARAFYNNPQIILLDEPCSGLDAISIKKIIQSLDSFKANKQTIIFSTHQPEILSIADDILLIVDGKTQIFGPRDKVINRLRNIQTKNESTK